MLRIKKNGRLIKELRYTEFAALSKKIVKVKRRKLGAKKFLVVELDTGQEVTEGDETNNITGKKLR